MRSRVKKQSAMSILIIWLHPPWASVSTSSASVVEAGYQFTTKLDRYWGITIHRIEERNVPYTEGRLLVFLQQDLAFTLVNGIQTLIFLRYLTDLQIFCLLRKLHHYDIRGQHQQTVKQAKYLGPTISSDLSWNQHVDNTVKKATNSLNFLGRNIRDCPPQVKEQCYKTLVCTTMEYASCVWDPYTNTNIKKLEMVQRRAVRFVKRDYDRTSSVTAMLDELGWDTLQERRQQAKATMFYRIVYGLVCVPSTPFLIPTLVSTTRGHDMKFLVPQSSVNAHKYSFFRSTTRIWNQLPQQAVSAPSLEVYKLLLQKSTM